MDDCDVRLIRDAIDYAFRFARLRGYQSNATSNLYLIMSPLQRQSLRFVEWYLAHLNAAIQHHSGNPIVVDEDEAEDMPELMTQSFNSPASVAAEELVDLPNSPPFVLHSPVLASADIYQYESDDAPSDDEDIYVVDNGEGSAAAVVVNGHMFFA